MQSAETAKCIKLVPSIISIIVICDEFQARHAGSRTYRVSLSERNKDGGSIRVDNCMKLKKVNLKNNRILKGCTESYSEKTFR